MIRDDWQDKSGLVGVVVSPSPDQQVRYVIDPEFTADEVAECKRDDAATHKTFEYPPFIDSKTGPVTRANGEAIYLFPIEHFNNDKVPSLREFIAAWMTQEDKPDVRARSAEFKQTREAIEEDAAARRGRIIMGHFERIRLGENSTDSGARQAMDDLLSDVERTQRSPEVRDAALKALGPSQLGKDFFAMLPPELLDELIAIYVRPSAPAPTDDLHR